MHLGCAVSIAVVLGGIRGGEGVAGEWQAPAQALQYELWEARWEDLPPADVNPHDPEQIEVYAQVGLPDGGTQIVPAFFADDFVRQVQDDREGLKPAGRPTWRVRFAGVQCGRHQVAFFRRQKGAVAEAVGTLALEVTPGPGEGFVRVAGAAKTSEGALWPQVEALTLERLPELSAPAASNFGPKATGGLAEEFGPRPLPGFVSSSGRAYFPLGHNVCWARREAGVAGYEHYFRRMSAAGENYARLWLCSWGLSLDTSRALRFDDADAWRLDQVLLAAGRLGIRLKLCLDNFHDFTVNFGDQPYHFHHGGPCRTGYDFFAGQAARSLYQRRLHYLVARYGAFASLMAWELWNEIDYSLVVEEAGGEAGARRLQIAWTREMADVLHRLDPFGHPVSVSLGNRAWWPELWAAPEIDFAQYHHYLNYGSELLGLGDRDAAGTVLAFAAQTHELGKPVQLDEFGYRGQGEISPYNVRDPRGIALHNALWAGALSGLSGPPAWWWWDNYIDPQGLYYHYRALNEFLAGWDWRKPVAPWQARGEHLRVVGLRSAQCSLIWVQNLASNWYARLERKQEPPEIAGAALRLQDLAAGRYRITWFDPYRGSALTGFVVEAAAGELRLEIPPLRTDLAVKVERLEF